MIARIFYISKRLCQKCDITHRGFRIVENERAFAMSRQIILQTLRNCDITHPAKAGFAEKWEGGEAS